MTKQEIPRDTIYAFVLEKCVQLKVEHVDPIMVSWLYLSLFNVNNFVVVHEQEARIREAGAQGNPFDLLQLLL